MSFQPSNQWELKNNLEESILVEIKEVMEDHLEHRDLRPLALSFGALVGPHDLFSTSTIWVLKHLRAIQCHV